MSDERDPLEMTRRAMLALTGSIGTTGIASKASAKEANQAMETQMQAANTGEKQVVGDEDWMYDTIQAAHDDLGESGGHIYVTAKYDAKEAGESFPIVLTKPVHLEGAGWGPTTISAKHAKDEDVIWIRADEQHYSQTVLVSNLRIFGGKIGIRISAQEHIHVSNVALFGQSSHGVAIFDDMDYVFDSFLNHFTNVMAGYGGGDGFHFEFEGKPHACVLHRCTGQGMDGNGAAITGYGVLVQGGAYEYNGKNGIKVKDTSAATIRDCYLEGNSNSDTQYADIYAHGHRPLLPMDAYDNEVMGTNSLTIEGNYFNNFDNDAGESNVGIHLEDSHGTQIQGNSWVMFHNESEGFVYIDESCTDVDYHRPSNYRANYVDAWDQRFVQEDNGYRTRSDGVIQPTDLSKVDGLYEGDKGIHLDATNPAKSNKTYIWRDGVWRSGEHMVKFTGREGYDSGAPITFDPGEWDGRTIYVDEATVPEGGFVSLLDLQGRLLGHSEYLAPGTHVDIRIDVEEGGTPGIVQNRRHPTHWLAAVAHRDTDANKAFDWESGTPEQVDEPYLEWNDGGPAWVYDGGSSTVVVSLPDPWQRYTVRDNAGAIESSDEGPSAGQGFVAIDKSSDATHAGAYRTLSSSDFEASVWVKADVHRKERWHHGHAVYLGQDGNGEHFAAGPINQGGENTPMLGIKNVSTGDWVDVQSLDGNWPKHAWLKLDVTKRGTDVSVTFTDPEAGATLGEGTFALPEDTNGRVGVHGTSGYGQRSEIYFDVESISPL